MTRCRGVTEQWWPLATAYAGLSGLAYPYRVKLRRGGEVVISDFYDLATFWPIFFTPAYPVEPSDRVIIDAGANVGMFTLYAALQAPAARIVAIEPFPSTFARLEQIVGANRLANVTCLNLALGERRGQAYMAAGDIGSQFREVVSGGDGRGGVPVPVLSLGDVLHEQGIEQVDLLKMDIEGSEYPAMLRAEPAVLRRVRRICIEYHPSPDRDASIGQLRAHLRRCGFVCTMMRDDGAGYGMARFVLEQPVAVG